MQLSFSYLQQFIAGDSNIHVDISSDYDSQKVLEVLYSMGSLWQQHITQPSHMGGHTLDLIITCEFDHITGSTPTPDHFLSDYKAILFSINTPKPPLAVKNLRYQITRQINVQSLMSDFSASRLCGNMPHQLNDLVYCYITTLSDSIEHHAYAPLKSCKDNNKTWYTLV